jgi:hypothetical protein
MPASHHHLRLAGAGMGRVTALPRPRREGLHSGGSGRGGEIHAGVGDGRRGGRQLG